MGVKVRVQFFDNNGQSITEEYGSESISELVAGNQSASDTSTPNYSVIGQYGNVKIQDKRNKILGDYFISGMLSSKAYIDVFYNNNLVGSFNSKSISYEEKDRKVIIDFDTAIELLTTTIFSKRYIASITAYDLLNLVNSSFASPLTIKYSNSNIETKLREIVIEDFYTQETTALEILNKICNLAMISILIRTGEMEVIDNV